jgi:hypothetical protein
MKFILDSNGLRKNIMWFHHILSYSFVWTCHVKGRAIFPVIPLVGVGGRNHPEEDLAKFGYRPDMDFVEKIKNPFQIWLSTRTGQV